MKQMLDRRRSEREFAKGEEVYLKLIHQHLEALTKQPISKLSPRFYGPYLVLARVGLVAYRLQLPECPNPTLLPSIREEAKPVIPIAILDRRIIYR